MCMDLEVCAESQRKVLGATSEWAIVRGERGAVDEERLESAVIVI